MLHHSNNGPTMNPGRKKLPASEFAKNPLEAIGKFVLLAQLAAPEPGCFKSHGVPTALPGMSGVVGA
jgi:hypothetical protein